MLKTYFSAILLALLTACSGESGEAKKLGFASVDEMKEVHAQGWHTKDRYEEDFAKKNGYSSVAEWRSAELKIKKQKEFEENWKNKGTHFVLVNCSPPAYMLAENAMLMLMRFGERSFTDTLNNDAFSRFCVNLNNSGGGYKTWDKYNERVKILGIKNNIIYWYAVVIDKQGPNIAVGVGGVTVYKD